jgi:hypothetical protein
MTEFLVVFPCVILLVFGIIQCALLYQVRSTLNYATLLAARAGALHNGDPARMRAALATGLAPLFARDTTLVDYARAVAEANLQTAAAASLVDLAVLNPQRAALADFGRPRIDGVAGRELPADTLNYRNPAPGAASGVSIQDANILHVRVSYCARLIVPVLDRVIYAAVNALTPASAALAANGMHDPFGTHGASPSSACANPLFKGPRIPIQSEAMVRMQSPFYESNL